MTRTGKVILAAVAVILGLPPWRVGASNTSIDATAELWAFFRQHPLH